MAFIETLIKSGVGVQVIYSDLLSPTARLLSDLWDQDRLSYTEVTIGLGRLQQLVHGLDWLSPYNGENDAGSRSVMFAPRPGEQQTFGFYIMEELFRWSGWRAWIETCASNAQMVANVQFRWFDMFCLSVCRDTNIEEVSTTIKVIRPATRICSSWSMASHLSIMSSSWKLSAPTHRRPAPKKRSTWRMMLCGAAIDP
jgi:methanogenic corrinoid protein MtbC1